MKLFVALVVILVIGAAFLGPQLFFVVDQNRVALVTRFGEVRKEIRTPGLKIKTPFVEQVTYYEKRLLLFDATPDSLLTKDKKRLIIDVYARGKIVNPKLFRETVRTEAQATSRAVSIIASELRTEIASDNQAEIITTQREPIMNRVKANVAPKIREFGIEVIDVRIKRGDFPVEIADSVYARMQAERKRKADRERAEGAEVDAQVRATVDRQATIIRANAERDASIVRGCGEAEAIQIFAEALERDPEFYTFQRSLEAYGNVFSQNTTVVLPVGGFGQLFEDIRQGVIQGTEIADTENGGVGPATAEIGPRCAEVGALRFLTSELKLDSLELELSNTEKTQWPDSSMGCPEEGKFYQQVPVSGFAVGFNYGDAVYEVHSNEHGSQVVQCNP